MSTAVRAWRPLPEIAVFAGDPFHRAPDEEFPAGPGRWGGVVRRPVALVTCRCTTMTGSASNLSGPDHGSAFV
ncbi:MAG: hypothetical protein WKF75_12260 [Singulisphaera sp.]